MQEAHEDFDHNVYEERTLIPVNEDFKYMKILLELSSSDTRTGAVRDALDLTQLTSSLGVEYVFCGELNDKMLALADRLGIAIQPGQSRIISKLGLPLYAFSVIVWIIRLFRLQPHLVHLNYASYGPSLACAAYICGIPILARSGPFLSRNFSNHWVDAYVANSEPHAMQLLKSPLADRVVIVGDFCLKDRLLEAQAPGRSLPPKIAGRPRFLFLGQIVERKGVDVLINAFAKMTEEADLLVVGGDWSQEGYPCRIRELVSHLGLAEHIHLENHRPDVAALLTDSDVFVLPSRSDAHPRSIIEAMTLGKPTVSTYVGGIPTLVDDGITGLLVPPDDPVALAAALDRMAKSIELRSRLGEAARLRAKDQFDPKKAADRYVELCRRLVSLRRGNCSRSEVRD